MSVQLGPIYDGQARFEKDWVAFSRLWLAVRDDWRDERCRQFQREHLSSLGPSLNRLSAALNEFCDEVRKADRALADEDQPSDGLH